MNNKYIEMVYEHTGDFYYYERIQTILYAFLAICWSLNWIKIIIMSQRSPLLIRERRKREYENDVFAIAMDWHKFEIHKQLQLQPDTNIQK